MRRPERFALAGLVALAGCGSAKTATVTVREPARTVTVRAAEASHTAPQPRVARLRRDGPPQLAALVPEDASVQDAWSLPAAGGVPEQLAVAWQRQTHPDDYAEHALVIWERSPTGRAWRRIHVLDDYRYAHKIDVHSLSAHVADVTGDGHLDVLAFQYTDGTGGCGDYDLLATEAGRARTIYASHECYDDAVIGLRPGELVIDRGFQYARGGKHIHPVFRTWRRTIKRWDGRRLRTVRRAVIAPSQLISARDG